MQSMRWFVGLFLLRFVSSGSILAIAADYRLPKPTFMVRAKNQPIVTQETPEISIFPKIRWSGSLFKDSNNKEQMQRIVTKSYDVVLALLTDFRPAHSNILAWRGISDSRSDKTPILIFSESRDPNVSKKLEGAEDRINLPENIESFTHVHRHSEADAQSEIVSYVFLDRVELFGKNGIPSDEGLLRFATVLARILFGEIQFYLERNVKQPQNLTKALEREMLVRSFDESANFVQRLLDRYDELYSTKDYWAFLERLLEQEVRRSQYVVAQPYETDRRADD